MGQPKLPVGLYGSVGVNFAEQFTLNPVILPICLLCMMMFNPIIKSTQD